MSDRPEIAGELARELALLRQAVAELAVAQAEGLNAMARFAQQSDAEVAGHVPYHYSGDKRPLTATDLRRRVAEVSERSLEIAKKLVRTSDG